jgi:hypothetical protein
MGELIAEKLIELLGSRDFFEEAGERSLEPIEASALSGSRKVIRPRRSRNRSLERAGRRLIFRLLPARLPSDAIVRDLDVETSE